MKMKTKNVSNYKWNKKTITFDISSMEKKSNGTTLKRAHPKIKTTKWIHTHTNTIFKIHRYWIFIHDHSAFMNANAEKTKPAKDIGKKHRVEEHTHTHTQTQWMGPLFYLLINTSMKCCPQIIIWIRICNVIRVWFTWSTCNNNSSYNTITKKLRLLKFIGAYKIICILLSRGKMWCLMVHTISP